MSDLLCCPKIIALVEDQAEPGRKRQKFVAQFIRKHVPKCAIGKIIGSNWQKTFAKDAQWQHDDHEDLVIKLANDNAKSGSGFIANDSDSDDAQITVQMPNH